MDKSKFNSLYQDNASIAVKLTLPLSLPFFFFDSSVIYDISELESTLQLINKKVEFFDFVNAFYLDYIHPKYLSAIYDTFPLYSLLSKVDILPYYYLADDLLMFPNFSMELFSKLTYLCTLNIPRSSSHFLSPYIYDFIEHQCKLAKSLLIYGSLNKSYYFCGPLNNHLSRTDSSIRIFDYISRGIKTLQGYCE